MSTNQSGVSIAEMRSDFERTGTLAPMYARALFARLDRTEAENERLRAENAVMERLKQRLIATTTLIEVELPYIDGRMDTTRHQAFIAAADRNRSALTKKEEGS